MKNDIKWLSYNDLAWIEPIITSTEVCREETELYSKVIIDNSKTKPKRLLHLGCGAGMNDFTFKKYFTVTGVDLSQPMLKIAHRLNPEVNYIHGDMRKIKLTERFDAVAIPDSIAYMTTESDLRKALKTAYYHLNPGGICLIVAHIRDTFQNNNFVYSGSQGDIHITVFENNYISSGTNYEATIVYLIRRQDNLDVFTDTHTLGLFDMRSWNNLFKETGFHLQQEEAPDTYARFIAGEGEYPQYIFIAKK